jgi:hypothetical protein
MAVDDSKQSNAAAVVGVVLGVAAVLLGAPVWGGMLVGGASTIVSKKIISDVNKAA